MALNCSPSSHSKSGESKNREGKPQDSWGTVSQAAWFLPGVDTLNRHQRPSFRQQRARLGHQMSVLSERSGGSTVCRADQRNTHALSLGAGTTRAQSLAICIQARHPGYPGISVKPWDVRKEPENLPFTPSCRFTAEAQTEEWTCPSHPIWIKLALEPKSWLHRSRLLPKTIQSALLLGRCEEEERTHS